MTKTKKKKQTEKLYCPYCGRMAVLRPAKHVYGSQNLDPGNYLNVCSGYPSCDSYIGVNSGIMTKKGIYIWLQNRFGLREKDMHIGKFSESRCEETARECKALLEQHTKRKQTVSNKTDLAA